MVRSLKNPQQLEHFIYRIKNLPTFEISHLLKSLRVHVNNRGGANVVAGGGAPLESDWPPQVPLAPNTTTVGMHLVDIHLPILLCI